MVLQGIAWCFRKCIWLIVTFISVVLIEKSHVGFCAKSVLLDFSFQDLQHLLLLLCPIPLVKVLRAGTFNLNTKIWSPDFSIWFCISTEHVRGQNRVKIISSSSRRWWSHPFLHSWLGEVCTNPDSNSFFFPSLLPAEVFLSVLLNFLMSCPTAHLWIYLWSFLASFDWKG